MAWLYYTVLLAVYVAGLALNVLGLPGLWLMVVGHVGYGWWTGWGLHVGWASVLWLTGLAAGAEIFEFVAGAAGSKSAGGGKRSMVGAIVGGLVGALAFTPLIPVPVVGTVVGAVVGAGLGASALEFTAGRRDPAHAGLAHWRRLGQVGVGAAKGRLWGIVGKTAFGLAMLVVGAATAVPLGRATPAPAPPTTVPAAAVVR